MAVYLLRVVGLEADLDRRQGGGGAGDCDRSLGGRTGLAGNGALNQGTDVRGKGLQLCRGRWVAGDVALGVAHDAGLERGVEGDLLAAADDQLSRAAAD